MGNVLGNLEPKAVWNYFEDICNHPHPSKKEDKLANFIIDWAKKNNLGCVRDTAGNIIVSKPATAGMENRKPITLQGHIDMVCEANSDVKIDFDNDPIQPYIDGDWVKAKGTTLGADNGIGVAYSMALMTSTDIPHPALELLCTLDEETGLTGATHLQPGILKGQILVNLDSEEDAAFTIGCAGGQNTSASFKYIADSVSGDSVAYEIALKGLKGGHSGIEIHDGRGNAIKLINRLLWNLTQEFDIRLASIVSGNKHNAIPREAFVEVTVAKKDENDFNAYIENFNKTLKAELLSKEPEINVSASKKVLPAKVMSKDMQLKLMNSLYSCPHGVIRMSPDIAGLVQTSTNLAIIETRENEVYILTSQRSSVESEKFDCSTMVRAAFANGGADVEHGEGYPGWEPNINSPILNTAKGIYTKLFGHEPRIEAIHAGLECGLVGEKYVGMDMLSFGPNLRDVHSPAEKVQISSVQKIWTLLTEIIKNIPEKTA